MFRGSCPRTDLNDVLAEVSGSCDGLSLAPFTWDTREKVKQCIMEVDGGK